MFNFLNKKSSNDDPDNLEVLEGVFDDDDIFGQKKEIPDIKRSVKGKEADQNINIERYRDPEGLTVRKMKIGLWLTANRSNFRLIYIFFLLLISILSWGWYLSVFGKLVFYDMKKDKAMMAELLAGNPAAYYFAVNNEAFPLESVQAEALPIDSEKFDFWAKIKNSNQRYYADFEYYFRYNGINTPVKNGFILPGEEKYVFALGERAGASGGRLEFVIKQVEWHRISSKRFGNWDTFAKDRLAVSTENIEYIPAQSSLSENININTLSFSTTNDSAYNYWSVAYLALLYDNNRVVGVNRYVLNRLLSGQTRDVSITWPQNIGRVTRSVVIPEIDISKNDIYIEYDGGSGDRK